MNNRKNQIILPKNPNKNYEKNYIRNGSKIIKQIIKQKKIFVINIFVYFFIILYYFIIKTHEYMLNSRKLISNSEILMTFTEIGTASILHNGFYYLPDHISQREENEDNQKIYIVSLSWNNSLINCSEMFKDVIKVKSFDFSNFDFSQVTDFSSMFSNCTSLQKINFGNSRIKIFNMNSTFYDCKNLQSLDFSNFDTSSVTTMANLFYGCNSLVSLDLTNFKTSELINMEAMFTNCNSLNSLKISSFETSKVENMAKMFYGCSSLISLDISNFETNNVANMKYMFSDCTNLVDLKLPSNFITSSVTNINSMFSGCSKLETLDLSTFSTNSVTNMESMFENCEKLSYLELSSFNTEKVDNMQRMFYGCSSLIYINLYSFLEKSDLIIDDIFTNTPDNLIYCINEQNTPKIKNVLSNKNTKNDCSNICFLETKQLNIEEKKCILDCSKSDNNNYEYNNTCYEGCPKRTMISSTNEFLCVDLNCEFYYNYEQTFCLTILEDGYYLNDTTLKTIDKCHTDCKTCNKSEENGNSNCLTCKDDNKYFESGNCVDKCEKDYYIDNLGNKICTCSANIKCKECSEESINLDLCISCNKDYYSKFNENYENSFVNCYKGLEEEGYYLIDNYYHPCYSSCKKCSEEGDADNHKCDECKNNYTLINETNKENNCYKKCSFYYYFDSSNQYQCTETKECPSEQNKLINEKNKCIDKCSNDNFYRYEYNNECYINCPTETILDNYICKDINIKTDEKELSPQTYKIRNNFNSSVFFNGVYNSDELNTLTKDEIIKSIKNDIINHRLDTLLSDVTGGNKEDLYTKEENVLYQITTTYNQNNKSYSNISTINLGTCEDTLKGIYNISSNLSLIIFKIDYYMEGLLIPLIGYEVYHPTNKSKLDLSYCDKSLINYNIPVSIDENNLDKYNPNSDYYNDECSTYTTEDGTDIIINDRQDEFVDNNMSLCENICDYIGYDKENKKALCQCGIKYNEFIISELNNEQNLLSGDFVKDNSTTNFGTLKCYETLFSKDGLLDNIGSFVLISVVLFYTISAIIFYKVGYEILKNYIKHIMSKFRDEKNNLENKKNESHNNQKINNTKDHSSKTNKKSKNSKKKLISNPKKKNENKSIDDTQSSKRKITKQNQNLFNKSKITKINSQVSIYKKNNKNTIIKKEEFVDFEINSFTYKEALIYDKRTLFEYYICLIKTKHPLIFSFCLFKDYNILIIKICIFFLSFTIHFGINGFFFNNTIIHQIYQNEGKYDLVCVLPRIIISFIISHIIILVIKFFSLTERQLLEIRKQTNYTNANKLAKKIKKYFCIKYIIFYLLSFLFLILLWYYLSSFCAVYQNSQVFLIINTIISFGLSLLYPFIINIIPAIFRIYSLKDPKENKECFFKVSKFLQFI